MLPKLRWKTLSPGLMIGCDPCVDDPVRASRNEQRSLPRLPKGIYFATSSNFRMKTAVQRRQIRYWVQVLSIYIQIIELQNLSQHLGLRYLTGKAIFDII